MKWTFIFFLCLSLCGLTLIVEAQNKPVSSASRPNIVFILMDNLGYGEPGCYGGGITRGAATPRIDKLASEGTRLLILMSRRNVPRVVLHS